MPNVLRSTGDYKEVKIKPMKEKKNEKNTEKNGVCSHLVVGSARARTFKKPVVRPANPTKRAANTSAWAARGHTVVYNFLKYSSRESEQDRRPME